MKIPPALPTASALVFPAAVSFAVTFALTPLVISVSSRLRIFDSPGPLKIHSRPVSRLGGLALFAGFVAGAALSPSVRQAFGGCAFYALALLWLVGFLDDLRALPVAIRLATQLAAASLIWLAGWRLPFPSAGWAAWLTLILFFMVFINAFNFLDGADGLASGVSLVVGLGFSAAIWLSHAALIPGSILSSCLALSCAAFLAFNFPPARIFLGDSGSTLLGFAFALLSLILFADTNPSTSAGCLFPFFAALLPLLDFFFAVFRRLRQGESPFSGDRRHFYDLLSARGWRARRVAGVSAALTAALVMLGLFVREESRALAGGILLVSVILFAILGVRLGSARAEDRGSPASEPE